MPRLRAEAANITLLLIEDHREIAEMIAEYFEQRGFAARYARETNAFVPGRSRR